MPRYLVTTRRDARLGGDAAPTAREAMSNEPGVTVLPSPDPHMVTIEASAETADRLRRRLDATHFIEPEIHRGLE
jgi:hypothetical protein